MWTPHFLLEDFLRDRTLVTKDITRKKVSEIIIILRLCIIVIITSWKVIRFGGYGLTNKHLAITWSLESSAMFPQYTHSPIILLAFWSASFFMAYTKTLIIRKIFRIITVQKVTSHAPPRHGLAHSAPISALSYISVIVKLQLIEGNWIVSCGLLDSDNSHWLSGWRT